MSAAPVYPLPRPADTDNRFSLGLALDIAAVLTRHGYPPITAGADLIRLHQAIFGLIYQHNNANDQPLDIPSSIGNQIPPSRHRRPDRNRQVGAGFLKIRRPAPDHLTVI